VTDLRASELIEQGDKLFDKRATLLSLWQEIAEHFYVERADFTVERTIGTTFAEKLMTSYPLIARRDLGNAFSAMLRPTAKEWFRTTITREERLDDTGRRWLAYANGVQRRAMYDRGTQFHRATKEADHDFAAFGQCVLSCELNRKGDALLYRCWHLRDVAWAEDADGKVATIHRKWKPYARDVAQLFPKTVSQRLKELADKSPYEEVELRHVMMPTEDWSNGIGEGGKKIRQPFVSIYLEGDGNAVLEETGSWNVRYIIPRWQTVSGSQYAYSPATVAALPDARLIQAVTMTLLEAGERFSNPPMIAVQEAIRSDVQVFAGGITWVDAEYDERLGEVLRPLTQDKAGMPLGRDLRNDVQAMIKEAFFLNKISLPQVGDNPEMTAFEVGQRVQDYIRNALPLFEPMEVEYNGALCDLTFDNLLRGGAFGPFDSIPRSLRGQEIQFRFESPLSDAIDAQKGQKLVQAKQLLAQVAELDPAAAQILDAKVALRDALIGAGVEPKWLRSPQEIHALAAQHAQQTQAAQLLDGLQKGAGLAKTVGEAQQALGTGAPGGPGAGTGLGGPLGPVPFGAASPGPASPPPGPGAAPPGIAPAGPPSALPPRPVAPGAQ
jgi:hypothetical protein